MRKQIRHSDIAIGNHPLTQASTHQDIYFLHLQHATLLGISPTSFQNWSTPSWSLNKNAMNNLLGTPLAPSVALQYVVEGMYGFSLIRSGYVLIIDVTLLSTIFPLFILRFCFKHNTAVDKRRQQSVGKVTHY